VDTLEILLRHCLLHFGFMDGVQAGLDTFGMALGYDMI
jgi:hypothetical protein